MWRRHGHIDKVAKALQLYLQQFSIEVAADAAIIKLYNVGGVEHAVAVFVLGAGLANHLGVDIGGSHVIDHYSELVTFLVLENVTEQRGLSSAEESSCSQGTHMWQ